MGSVRDVVRRTVQKEGENVEDAREKNRKDAHKIDKICRNTLKKERERDTRTLLIIYCNNICSSSRVELTLKDAKLVRF